MYLVYVDESGDSGLSGSPSTHFVLSALVVHETRWMQFLNDIIRFRRKIRDEYGVKLREEIHTTDLFSRPKELFRLQKHVRLQICKKMIDFQESLNYINLVNVVVRKEGKSDQFNVFENAWTYLIQRIHNTVHYRNFPDGYNENEGAIIIPDQTNNKKLNRIVRKMRRYNPVPNMGFSGYRHLETNFIIEDPYYKDSRHSLIHQLVDVNAYFLYQMHNPNKFMKKKKADNFFKRYDKVLCKVASTKDKRFGIVYI